MNTAQLKSYAPQARKDFIAAVTARANLLGLSDTKGVLQVADAAASGDLVMIAGRPWPLRVNEQRSNLISRMKQQGFGQTVEAVAYSWFNRLAALRFMELHDYLGHGRRVLSNPAGGLPEVLTHALELAEAGTLPGLVPDKVRELKLANQDAELYRQVLIAQCNALHQAMPFLFEPLGDETELLLPENLLLSDSVVAKLVQSIPEDDWQQIEIIGWLYQFYISEKKDQVIGKVVKSEDIPAATQLFTPNWIVKYMVQNSLGAQWLATYPDSSIKAKMAYYIEPAEQADTVNAQLASITPSSLDPEALTLIDPACGSGHILVEAYDLFKLIYLDRGYQQRDLPKLILEKNLFGLDIDERAAQLTGFALMMKGRADDRRLFERDVHLNVMAIQDSAGFDTERFSEGVKWFDYRLESRDLRQLKRLFERGTTIGSLIQVPEELTAKLPALKQLSETTGQDLFASQALKRLGSLVEQATLLAAQYDVVVANPPYMGARYMGPELKNFVVEYFAETKSDLFACFIKRGGALAKESGYNAMVTMQTWMFLSSYAQMRARILSETSIRTMAHMSNGVMGIAFGTAATVLRNSSVDGYISSYSFTSIDDLTAQRVPFEFPVRNKRLKEVAQSDFSSIPGSPVAYWVSSAFRGLFESNENLGSRLTTRQGLATGDNNRFVRAWQEVSIDLVSPPSDTDKRKGKWAFFISGGKYRKWHGNIEWVVNWENDGLEIRNNTDPNGRQRSRPQSTAFYFKENIVCAALTSGDNAFRYSPPGTIFDVNVRASFAAARGTLVASLAVLNSPIMRAFSAVLSPTLAVNIKELELTPLPASVLSEPVVNRSLRCISGAKEDWDAYERSWDFQSIPMLTTSTDASSTLESNFSTWITRNRATIAEMKCLEEENNRLFIDAYGLQDEISPDVPIEQITLTVNPAYRYGGRLSETEQWARFRTDTMQELVSYAVGCTMGRYSLDEPGLIYAKTGNDGFDASRYTTFVADADGIVPLTEDLWFEDDAALRVREFLHAACGSENVEENMDWLAVSLGKKPGESPEDSVRRYLADKFFKDHLQTYKKRPVYWLFSSGKQGAFQALVYLHRYNAGTLSRLRAEYVVPLIGKMQSRIEQLERDAAAASSTAARNRASKRLEHLRKQHLELLAYDEQLRHFADMRIELDLDEGVKVNYGKFGDLLADVKAVTGGKGDDE